MDDSEYYAMMRRQYSNPISFKKKSAVTDKSSAKNLEQKTPGTFGEWTKKYGHEDAEMFMERNSEDLE